MRHIRKPALSVLSVLLFAALMLSSLVLPAFAEEGEGTDKGEIYVMAHWKFQNDPKYVTGSVDDDNLTFKDLTGNGNDLITACEGMGDVLDIFSWDVGVNNDDLTNDENATALKFDNSLAKSKSVDPYDPSETAYSGGYVSGKYLQTVSTAPINNIHSTTGWSVEIIFKVSPEFNNSYNRYCGLFSRQGVIESQNEPAFSMALTEFDDGEADGSLGANGRLGYQYLHVDVDEIKTNHEMQNGTLAADTWHHFMISSDGELTEVYIDGEYICVLEENNDIYISDPNFSWEVGVGRKLKGTNATMNEEYPQGLIRRLFCGTISEIRFCMDYVDVEESLLYKTELVEEDESSDDPAETKAPEVKPKLEHDNIIDLWDAEALEGVFRNDGNQTLAEVCDEGLKLSYLGAEGDSPDPFYKFPIASFYKKYDNSAPAPAKCNYVVFKIKGEGLDGAFELFTHDPKGGDSDAVSFTPEDADEDGWTYLILDMSCTSLVDPKRLTTMRIDYSGGGTAVGAYCIIGAIGFFEEEEAAYVFAKQEYEPYVPETRAPKTEAPTEAPTEPVATEEVTEAEKSGCSSAMVPCAMVMLAAAAAVALKRKH